VPIIAKPTAAVMRSATSDFATLTIARAISNQRGRQVFVAEEAHG
jgi:hypothetical protein